MYAVDILDADLKFTHLVEEIERGENSTLSLRAMVNHPQC